MFLGENGISELAGFEDRLIANEGGPITLHPSDIPHFGLFDVIEAQVAFDEAYAINPDRPYVARQMLVLEEAIGQGNREAMELWFDRAMKLDDDDQVACWAKLDWLDPEWHREAVGWRMLAFGKA